MRHFPREFANSMVNPEAVFTIEFAKYLVWK